MFFFSYFKFVCIGKLMMKESTQLEISHTYQQNKLLVFVFMAALLQFFIHSHSSSIFVRCYAFSYTLYVVNFFLNMLSSDCLLLHTHPDFRSISKSLFSLTFDKGNRHCALHIILNSNTACINI